MPEQNNPSPGNKTAQYIEQSATEVNNTLEMLSTQVDQAGVFGFGRRILVPPDEIHVVVGDGRHKSWTSQERSVYGQTEVANQTSSYWLNSLTQVVKLKTISFNVPLLGADNQGIEAFDKSKISFRVHAHAVAKLNPDKAEIAAQRVGLDTTSLIQTITKVGAAAVVTVAATMHLEEIISNRQDLVEKASTQVNAVLEKLGYDLALLTITRLDGDAYRRLVQEAEVRVTKETTVKINKEQLETNEDNAEREQKEAEIQAQTEKKLAAERLDVETATLSQKEALDIRQHDLNLLQIGREQTAASKAHDAELAQVKLAHEQAQTEAENQAELARYEATRLADLRAKEQERQATISLAETGAEADRLAAEQSRKISRDADRTEAEAKRLEAEELAQAERAKKIALVEAQQLAEAMKVEAEAQADATRITVETETENERIQAEAKAKSQQIRSEAESKAQQIRAEAEAKAQQIRAEAEANSTTKQAEAAKIRAEATRAENAAPGLAQAEVESARIEVAEKQVAVTQAEGLAKAEIARATANAETERVQRLKDVEINAQIQLAELYQKAPVLVELERMRAEFEHTERLANIQAETQLKAFEALAPSMRIHIYGNGGQASQILTDVMSFSHGLQQLGDEVPAVGRLLNGANGKEAALSLSGLTRFLPYIQQAMGGMNPRMISSLKVGDLVERLGPVIAGQEDLVSALGNLRQDANFRVVGDLPVKPILGLLGVNLPEASPDDVDALSPEPEDLGALPQGDDPEDERGK